MTRHKTEAVVTTVGEAFKKACSEVLLLTDEMEGWERGLEDSNLEKTRKYGEVSGTASVLDNMRDRLKAMKLPETALHRMCQYTWVRPYGKNIGRSWRASHVAQALRAVAEGVVHEQDVEETYGELCDIADTIESIEFPGMI